MKASRIFILAGVLIASLFAGTTERAGAESRDHWVPSQIQQTTIPLIWSHASLNDTVTLDSLGRRPKDDAKLTYFLACERADQLDCFESVGLVSANGTYSPGTFLRGKTYDVTNYCANTGFCDVTPFSAHSTVWSVPGMVVNGAPQLLNLEGGAGGSEANSSLGLGIGITMENPQNVAATPGNPRGCQGAIGSECSYPPDYPEGTILRVVLRTSWFAPNAIFVRGKNNSISLEDLGNGAHRITVTGEPMLLQSMNSLEIASGVPQWVTSAFNFVLYDPRRGGTTVGGDCTVNNPFVISGNGSQAELPTWDAATGRLDLRMVAPHFWADGTTEWSGYYETNIPADAVKCMWGIDPRVTTALSLGVFDANGNPKPSTTSVTLVDDVLQLRASGFTFSENRVTAKVKPKVGNKCFKKSVKVGKYVCKKKPKSKKLVWIKRR